MLRDNFIYKNNQSLKFILPLLAEQEFKGNNEKRSPYFYTRSNFIGCFLGDKEKQQWDGSILLAYRLRPTVDDIDFQVQLREHKWFKGSYRYYPSSTAVFAFIPTKEIEEEIDKVLSGNYSQLKPESKLAITKFWSIHGSDSLLVSIFGKDTSKIDKLIKDCDTKNHCRIGEHWVIPDIEQEMLDKETL